MAQEARRDHGRRSRIVAAALVVAAAVVILTAAAPRGALARPAYIHGGIAAEDCETCHVNAHTWWTPTNEHCLGCHPGFQVTDPTDPELTCWTCHAPGQDMSASRVDAACTAACHLRDGSTVTHQAHAGGSAACTSCHPVTASPTDPAGSAHHTVAPPVLTTVDAGVRAAGRPGHADRQPLHRRDRGLLQRRTRGVRGRVRLADHGGRRRRRHDRAVSVISRGGKAAGADAFTVTVVSSLTLKAGPAVQTLGRRVRLGGTLEAARVGRRPPDPLRAAASRRCLEDDQDGLSRHLVDGRFGWSYAPSRRGEYRAAASLAASPASTAARSRWVGFRIR